MFDFGPEQGAKLRKSKNVNIEVKEARESPFLLKAVFTFCKNIYSKQ